MLRRAFKSGAVGLRRALRKAEGDAEAGADGLRRAAGGAEGLEAGSEAGWAEQPPPARAARVRGASPSRMLMLGNCPERRGGAERSAGCPPSLTPSPLLSPRAAAASPPRPP